MALDKGIEVAVNIGTLAALSTIPASPGGTECVDIDMDLSASFALTLEGSFTTGGTLTAHLRTSPVGGTDPAVWDTQDYMSFDLIASGAGREQITFGVWPDPLHGCVMIGNPGTEPVFAVKATRTLQDVEAI